MLFLLFSVASTHKICFIILDTTIMTALSVFFIMTFDWMLSFAFYFLLSFTTENLHNILFTHFKQKYIVKKHDSSELVKCGCKQQTRVVLYWKRWKFENFL